ncbi:MAG: hypothetical protein ABI592_10305 [Acidobacteriota bacterium]
MNVSSLAGLAWRLPLILLAALAECFLLRLLLPRPSGEWAPAPEPRAITLAEGLALTMTLAAVAIAAAATLSTSATSPDLLLFWGPKAEAFAAAKGLDAGYLGDPLLRYQHHSYPPLVPQVYAFATIAAGAGRLPWMAAAATFPLLLAATAAGLFGVLRASFPRRDAAIATAAVSAALGLFGHVFAVAGNADPALLLFETLALGILVGEAGGSDGGQLLAGMLFAGALAAKVEGLPFVAAAGGLFLLARGRSVAWRRAPAWLFVPGILSLGAWFAFGRARHLFRAYETYGPTFEVHTERLGLVLVAIGKALFGAAAGLPWLLPLAALLFAGRRAKASLYPAAIAGSLSVFFVFTYLHGAPDPALWIEWSAGRIFSIVSVLLTLAVIAARPARDGAGEGETPRAPARGR